MANSDHHWLGGTCWWEVDNQGEEAGLRSSSCYLRQSLSGEVRRGWACVANFITCHEKARNALCMGRIQNRLGIFFPTFVLEFSDFFNLLLVRFHHAGGNYREASYPRRNNEFCVGVETSTLRSWRLTNNAAKHHVTLPTSNFASCSNFKRWSAFTWMLYSDQEQIWSASGVIGSGSIRSRVKLFTASLLDVQH